jgi:hypothetical protein
MVFKPTPDPDYDDGFESSPQSYPKMGKIPRTPIIGLPSFGFPSLPSFDFDFGLNIKQPGFIKEVADDLKYEALVKLVNELNLDVDLDYDLKLDEVVKAIKKAAGEKGGAAAARVAKGVADALKVDLSKWVKAPIPPIIGLPSFGFPSLPSFDFDFGLNIEDPLAKLERWLKD